MNRADRRRLASIVTDGNGQQNHVRHARIVLLMGDGLGTAVITRHTGKGKSVIWCWQERFLHASINGLLRDKTPPPRRPRWSGR